MATQERIVLLSGGDSSPKAVLLDDLFNELPREEQIGHITSVLQRREVWNDFREEGVISLIEVLEELFQDDGAVFRSHLMELYRSIPTCVDGDRLYGEKIEAAPALKLAILGKILRGWNWAKPQFASFRAPKVLQDGAEECFRFVCKAYREAPQRHVAGVYPNPNAGREEGRLLKKIPILFQEHLEKYHPEFPSELDRWILDDDTPLAIALVLIKGRARLGGLILATKELPLLDAFQSPFRSTEGTALALDYLARIRRTEELAQKLVERIQPTDSIGTLNSATLLDRSDSVTWKTESSDKARVRILTRFPPVPAIISKIEEIKDGILRGIEGQPQILIEVEVRRWSP